MREPRTGRRWRLPTSWLVTALPFGYVVADLLETGYTFQAFGCEQVFGSDCAFAITVGQAQWIHIFSDVKWGVLFLNLAAIAGLYFWSGANGRASWQLRRDRRSAVRLLERTVSGPPVGAYIVVGLLVVLLAVPGGGALDQMPDVIRSQIDHAQGVPPDGRDLAHVWASLLGLPRVPRDPADGRVRRAARAGGSARAGAAARAAQGQGRGGALLGGVADPRHDPRRRCPRGVARDPGHAPVDRGRQ